MNVEALGDGAILYKSLIPQADQMSIANHVIAKSSDAGWLSPVTPAGKPFSVRQMNFGSLGWVSDRKGYRYEPNHPVTGEPWPGIPAVITGLWQQLLPDALSPQCCLVNHYTDKAKMGMHRDADEDDMQTPILSISLGTPARFRIGGAKRGGPTKSIALHSGDVIILGGPSRHFYHGIDRLLPTDPLFAPHFPFEGRLNLTLRRVTQ